MKKLIVPALLAMMLAACSSTGPDATGAAVEDRSGAGVATVTAPGASGTGIAALTDPNNILSKRNVFFEYDSFTVADQYKPIVEAHARYLNANRNAKVALQGHA